MAQTVSVIIGAEDRERLTAVIGDRNRPQKHIQRARIVLLSAERLPVLTVAGQVGVSRPAVWRWQQRFAEAGVDGLLRDKTRKPGKAPLSAETVAKVLALPCAEPPGEATHWTGRAVARAVGVSLRAVQRIWQAHRLQPHRIRTFKRSTDPDFAENVEDIVGLYIDPPRHAVVLSIDEKSQIQALDRTQPGLPLKPGKCGTNDPRLQTQRHDDAVCRPQRARGQGRRRLHVAPPASGFHQVPQCHRTCRAVRQGDPRDPRQLPRTSIRRSRLGSPTILAGCSTSRRPRHPG
jgi:transposase